MAHLSPVNGAYPHKDQIDRSCFVKANEASKAIERGTIIFVNEDGEFEVAADATKQPLYFALQGYGNLQAAMAGGVGYGKGNPKGVPAYKDAVGGHNLAGHAAAPSGQPKITGLSFQEHGNYQTDVYDKAATYKIGMPLTVKNGEFTPATGDNASAPVVAHVYAEPDEYYANDAVLQEGWSTGNWIKVLRVSL